MTFGSLGYGPPGAQSVLHCHGVLALRQGPWTPAWTEAVQNESQLQEASFTEHGVAAERKRAPGGHLSRVAAWTEAVQKRKVKLKGGHELGFLQNESQLQESDVWQSGLVGSGQNPSFNCQWCFSPATRVLGRSRKWTFEAPSGLRAAGPIRPSLPWCFSPASGSLDSSLDRSCAERKPAPGGHEQGGCRTKASSRRTRAGWQLAVQKRRSSQGLRASF